MNKKTLILIVLIEFIILSALAYLQMFWVVFGMLAAVVLASTVIIYNYFIAIDDVYDLYDSNEFMSSYINKLYSDITEAYNKMIEIDKKQWFASDDEVGFVFKRLKETMMDIEKSLLNLKK